MKLKHFLIFLSIIIFATLPVNSNVITYTERETTEFEIENILTYEDNTIVLQIVHKIITSSGEICFEANISFRVIYPNGTITPIDLSIKELGIQYFNFCTGNTLIPIVLYAIETKEDNFILVTYTEAADVNNPLTYDDYIMLIDLNGKIYSKTLMGPSFVVDNIWTPQQFTIVPNANNEQGFLYSTLLSSNNTVIYYYNSTQWIINEDGTLSNIATMVLPFQLLPFIVSTVDGGYMFIYPTFANSTITSQDHFTPQTGLYAMYCGYGSNIVREPVILYETTMVLNITGFNCVISYPEIGQICLIIIQSNSTNPNIAPILIKVNYLSGGSVFSITNMNIDNSQYIDPIFLIQPLQFGGYFYGVITSVDQTPYNIWGYVLDDNGNFIQWNLSNPAQLDSNASPQVLTNNTLVIVQPIVGQYWSLITTDLYKFHEDNSYHNIFINTTNPTIGQNIIANETYFLTITYTVPVVLSNGTITIFQNNGSSNPGIVRQIINGLNNNEYITINNDTVSVTIIESTFNNPGSTYYVMIEYTFVSSLLYNEPLPGLSNKIWSFTTFPEEKEQDSKIKQFFDGIYGKVRLTKDGTSYFDTLNLNQQNKFFNNLTRELANAVVVASKRITTNYRFVIDTESSSKQYLLFIKIEKPQAASDRGTRLITKDLNAMIQNMDITVLASGSSSKYLESIYGYVTITVPYIMKLGYAVYIILNELVRKENSKDSNQLLNKQDHSQCQQDKAKKKVTIKKWLKNSKNYKIILVILISLAGAEIEVLKMVDFQFYGYKFNVELSEEFEERIIFGEIIGIIIKNIPDLAIRIYYLNEAIDNNYLSILALLITIIKILGLITNPIKLMS
ncbi:hypothetical protein RclHR1_21320001 [Rhizophagus clarus]|uniref:SbsA Ig-like domain-containing protein n=1 Tax=Rhizophagus clarus TaxID=94130 RepID=A0A2Z6R639_9GLOM|nr:hypothetical protein RclHR1_21320001 [Rhizophagus clarus]GES92236.1 hypothetical protein GLOIN_2v1886197 [Rhizophagus clarus]